MAGYAGVRWHVPRSNGSQIQSYITQVRDRTRRTQGNRICEIGHVWPHTAPGWEVSSEEQEEWSEWRSLASTSSPEVGLDIPQSRAIDARSVRVSAVNGLGSSAWSAPCTIYRATDPFFFDAPRVDSRKSHVSDVLARGYDLTLIVP